MPPQEQQISSASVVQSDLAVSWNTGQGPFYWYRVEGECGDIDCETMGVQSQSCPGLTYIATVAARSLEELCNILTNPRTTQPFVGKIKSLRRYSRPTIKPVVETGDCNLLDGVEFCQVPECLDFCPETSSSYMGSLGASPVFFGHPIRPGNVLSSLSDFEFGFEVTETPLLSQSGLEILTQSDEPIFATSSEPTSPSPGILVSGSAYVVSPVGYFDASGSISVLGSIRMVKEHEASGSLAASGSAEFGLELKVAASGSVTLSGEASNQSPSYNYDASGLIALSGLISIISYFRNLGTLTATMNIDSLAFDFGFDYSDGRDFSELTISDFSVDACGCSGIGPTVSLTHNLTSSESFSRFLGSAGLSYPSTATLRYKSSDSAWVSNDLLKGRNSDWSVAMSFQCQDDQWRLSLGVSEGTRSTRVVLDIPADIFCGEGSLFARAEAYFRAYQSEPGRGVKIDAVRPRKPRRASVLGEVELYANGIFMPQTLYYDDLELFKDQYWYASPLEIELNAPARLRSSVMDVSWV